MCGKKKLRMPPYAFKFPWRLGSVLQYKISYPVEDNIYYGKYVLLLVTGVSKTMPFKIPCESTSFSLYGWCGEKEPSQQVDVILNESPGLINLYSPYSRINKAYVTHTVLWNKSIIKLYDIKCISETPLPGTEFNITEPG